MEETLSLSWEAHQNNICSGLSLLQQRGEFVDMTLAADGHHVKVHQMVMSLVSPYIKELISTAQCPHPVIFLNDISYTTLCAILEYIYTGEVILPKEKLSELLAAGRALHIKGLREMPDNGTSEPDDPTEAMEPTKSLIERLRENMRNNPPKPICGVFFNSDEENTMDTDDHDMSATIETLDEDLEDTKTEPKIETKIDTKTAIELKPKEYGTTSNIQYSVSNQGGLQVIINRYIYNLKYVQKNLNRYWRCVDYAYKKCPANVYTNDKNEVLKRKCTHNHPFHDSKILKKVRVGMIYAAYNEAETRAREKKTGETIEIVACTPSSQSNDTE